MNNFEAELKKGNFLVSKCTHCKKIVWPPSKFCNRCFQKNSWKKVSKRGRIVEFSKQNNFYFCLAEFENTIRIIGKILSGMPQVDQNIMIEKCGIDSDGNPYFEMKLTE